LQRKKKFLTFTGMSFYPFLQRFVERFSERENVQIELLPIENRFFGSSITVAGLLTGRDVIKTVLDRTDGHELFLIPDVVLDGEDRFLDNLTLRDIEEALGIPVRKIASTPDGLVNGLSQAA